MRSIKIILIIAALVGCESHEASKNEVAGLEESTNWELIEIKEAYEDWKPVSPEQKQFLTFGENDLVEYADAQNSCEGRYHFQTFENSNLLGRLELRVPCMVSAEQLWWSHIIEEKSDNFVITAPRLNPTAMMSSTRHKYRIVKSGYTQ